MRASPMDANPIPAALAKALRNLYAAAPPIALGAERVRVRNQTGELPAPRIEILTGEPVRVPKMDATARQPVTLSLITSLDAGDFDHESAAGELETWWLALRADRKPGPFAALYLHDVLYQPAKTEQLAEDREEVTRFPATFVVSLYDPDSIV